MRSPTVEELGGPENEVRIGTTTADSVLKLVARTPVYVPLDATLREAAVLLTEESIGALLVSGRHGVAGLLSERDVVAALAEGAAPDRDRVRDYMTPDLASVPVEATIAEAEERMLANEIRHLVVTKGDKTIGLISMRDILTAASGS